ncbi:MAG: protein kinase [Thermodesulfobacteriota bacterium]
MSNPAVHEQPSPKGRKPAFEPVIFGNYILIDHIAKGGMADVYLAKSAGLHTFQKPVVVKKLFSHYSANRRFVDRFQHEAAALCLLNCSNVVQIIDMGSIDNEYYITMEYIEGRSAAHILSKAKKSSELPPLELALHVFLEVAKGLGYAHRKRDPEGQDLMLIHQDINTFNVMVSYEAEVKIIDFGIARLLRNAAETEALPMTGKLLYFAPEQLEGKPVDRRVDIYGAGELLFEMVTGDRLVEHQQTVTDTLRMILDLDIEEKVAAYADIPPDLRPILIKSMARDPQHRYARLEDMARDVRGFIRSCRLEIMQHRLADYMKEKFVRERLADDFRMRKLWNADLSAVHPPQGPPSIEATQQATPQTVRLPVEELLSTITLESGTKTAQHLDPGLVPREVCFPEGGIIVQQGEPATCLYVIQKGKVRVYQKFGSQEQTLGILRDGDFFGESAFLDEQTHSAAAVALENCHIVLIKKESLTGLASRELINAMVAGMVTKLRDMRSVLMGSLLKDPLSRLVYALIIFGRRAELQDGQSIDLDEVLDLFGLESRDQMKKYVEKLEELEIVYPRGPTLEVKDTQRLENILSVLSKSGKLILRV